MGGEIDRTELQLETSQFIAALQRASKEESTFFGALKLLNEEVKRTETSSDSLARALQQLGNTEAALVPINASAAESTGATAPAFAKASSEATKFAASNEKVGHGVLQVSYAVQDFVSVLVGGQGLGRAIGSVQNNIPGLVMSLGAGAGLAGTVSLVALGLGTAVDVARKFASAEDDVAEAAKKATEELKRQAEAVEKIQGRGTSEQDAIKKMVDEVIKETPGKGVVQGIDETLRSRSLAQFRENYQREIQQHGVYLSGTTVDDWMADAKKRSDEYRNKLMDRIGTDPSARQELLDMTAERPGAFPKGFKERFAQTMPAAREAAQEQARAAESQSDQAEREAARRERVKREAARDQSQEAERQTDQAEAEAARRQRRKQEASVLNRAGQENESAEARDQQGRQDREARDAHNFSNAVMRARQDRRTAVRPMIDVNAPLATQQAQMAEAGAANRLNQEQGNRDIAQALREAEAANQVAGEIAQQGDGSRADVARLRHELTALRRQLNRLQARGQKGIYVPVPEFW